MRFYSCFFIVLLIATSLKIEAQDSITVDKIWAKYEFVAKRIPGFKFMNDGKHYTRLQQNEIRKYDLTTGNMVEVLLSGTSLDVEGKIDSYEFNADETRIILEFDSEPIYRRSSKAYFYIYDRGSKDLTPVYEEDKVMYATLSPDATKVAYVWQNNIYYLDLADGVTHPVTVDGKINHVINGSADWVYEEEFSFAQAFFWSPDSRNIAYYKFDESEVPEFTMTNYNNDLYPEYVTFKYPKVGEKNAVVTIHTYNVKSDKTNQLNTGSEKDIYIPRIKWTNDPTKLLVYKMNRHQNLLELLLADVTKGELKKVLQEQNEYYIDVTDDIRFLENDKQFIWSSEKSGYNHLYLYDFSGKEVKALTSGNYDVTNFYGIDEKNNRVYYQAAEKSPLAREVYSVDLKGKNKKTEAGGNGTNSMQYSSTFDYGVLNFSTANSPAEYQVMDRKGKVVRVLEDNANMQQLQKNYNASPVEFMTVPGDDGTALNAWMIKPPNFDSNKSYPLFMYLYAGPGSQTVTDSWKGMNYWWFQMLAQQGYVVVSVDSRGTGARGEAFKKMTYMNLGHYETLDQIAAAKHLGSMPYIDSERIGIFGWSYGGYMSSLCLFKGNDVFKAAIAVAPVTNWRWYDTIYTERYMRTEDENPDGYADNSPVNFAHRLEGDYLLIHGMGDDNVHWQNSVEMANALIKANKQFDTYYYPNRHHGISGENTRHHLYNKMTDFILEKL